MSGLVTDETEQGLGSGCPESTRNTPRSTIAFNRSTSTPAANIDSSQSTNDSSDNIGMVIAIAAAAAAVCCFAAVLVIFLRRSRGSDKNPRQVFTNPMYDTTNALVGAPSNMAGPGPVLYEDPDQGPESPAYLEPSNFNYDRQSSSA